MKYFITLFIFICGITTNAHSTEPMSEQDCASVNHFVILNDQASEAARTFNCSENNWDEVPIAGLAGSQNLASLIKDCNDIKFSKKNRDLNGNPKVIPTERMPTFNLGEKNGYRSLVRTSVQCRAIDVCYQWIAPKYSTEKVEYKCYTYAWDSMVGNALASPNYCGRTAGIQYGDTYGPAAPRIFATRKKDRSVSEPSDPISTAKDEGLDIHVKMFSSKSPLNSLNGLFIPLLRNSVLKKQLHAYWNAYYESCFGMPSPDMLDGEVEAKELVLANWKQYQTRAVQTLCEIAINGFWTKANQVLKNECSQYDLRELESK